MKAIKNAKIIFPDSIEEGLTIFFSDKIEKITKDEKTEDGVEAIDAKGAYLAPGLLDIHIHGYMGRDFCEGKEDALREIAKGIVKNGVTGFLPTTMTESLETIESAIGVARNLKEESILDKGFEPLSLKVREMREKTLSDGQDIVLAVERNKGYTFTYKTRIFKEGTGHDEENFLFVERMVKALLWVAAASLPKIN